MSASLRNDTAEALEVGGRHMKTNNIFSSGTDQQSHSASPNQNIQFEFKVKPVKEDEAIVRRDALFILNLLGINQDGSPLARPESDPTRVPPQAPRTQHGEGAPIPLNGRLAKNMKGPEPWQ